MKKVVIFDLDGTLLNTIISIAYCGNLAVKKFGFEELDVSVYPQFVGHGADYLVEKLAKYVGVLPEKFAEFKEYYMEVYNKNGSKNISPYEQIPELLESLKCKGIKLAVLSNKPQLITQTCCGKYFEDTFDIICGQKDGVPVKPDTTQLYQILKEFNVSNDECIYCGDSGVDIQTGKNANVFTLGAAWGFYSDKPFADADAIIYKPSELLKYI